MLATLHPVGAAAQDGGRPGPEALPSERLRVRGRAATALPAYRSGSGSVPTVSSSLADGQDGYQQAGRCGSKRGC
jgi:hypothetical protein